MRVIAFYSGPTETQALTAGIIARGLGSVLVSFDVDICEVKTPSKRRNLRATKKNVKTPDETRKFPKGKLEVVKVGDFTIGKGTYRAGWKWSESVKPVVKTEHCQAHHVGYAISGRMAGVMEDGSKWEIGPGDVVDIPPGHDAWVVGKAPFVLIDFMGATSHAKTN